jgi:tripartite-type tricarboxylate transporter receptor subunit TctC
MIRRKDFISGIGAVAWPLAARANSGGRHMIKLSRRRLLQLGTGAAALPAVSSIGWAQAYPSRPIRPVVPFPPGGAFDAIGRPWAEKMKPVLGTVVVENIGGGGSSLGAAAVARARPDGYTILLGGTLPHINEALLKTRPLYDPVKDLDPISSVAVSVFALAVHPSIPAHTLKEFAAHAKAESDKMSYAHVGVGSLNQLIGELFKSLARLPDLVQVPYRGAGPALNDLIGGQTPMAVVGLTGQVIEFHRSGKLRVLAVAAPVRRVAAPEFLTAAESGFPGLTVEGTLGLLAPAGTPKPIIEQIAQASRTALIERAYQDFLIEAGFEPALDSSPDKLRRTLEQDVALWTPIVKQLGLKID